MPGNNTSLFVRQLQHSRRLDGAALHSIEETAEQYHVSKLRCRCKLNEDMSLSATIVY